MVRFRAEKKALFYLIHLTLPMCIGGRKPYTGQAPATASTGYRLIDTTRLTPARIAWNDSGHPRSLAYDDIYFSGQDALAESRHVFLAGNDLHTRFAVPDVSRFTVGECGFGFGLNFLLTCELFCRLAPPRARLQFVSCECHPVTPADLQRFYATLPAELRPFADALLATYPLPVRGLHRLALAHGSHTLTLDLVFDDAADAFARLPTPFFRPDAWYLDGFAPAVNDTLWQPALFRTLYRRSHAATTLATYTAAGAVRRGLQAAGFTVRKVPGFGSKRHMLAGGIEQPPSDEDVVRAGWSCPWRGNRHLISRVAVIGGGLAGCATAHALASRHLEVTVLEKQPALAREASGNPRGIVHFNPGKRLTPANRFRLTAYLHALRHYRALSRAHDFDWQAPGLLQLAQTETEVAGIRDLLDRQLYDSRVLQQRSARLRLAGPDVEGDTTGLLFPQAGSLSPPRLCGAWMKHDGIELLTGCTVTDMTFSGSRWHLQLGENGKSHARTFDAVVICTNHHTTSLPGLPGYPLATNYGQTDTYVLNDDEVADDWILRHQGYLIPWCRDGRDVITIGGSVVQAMPAEDPGAVLAGKNLSLLAGFAPRLAQSLEQRQGTVQSHRGTRATTPDYLPLAGPVEDRDACEKLFAGYAGNARRHVPVLPRYQPNLYINVAHGSSGLIFTPLIADYLASLLTDDTLPLEQDLVAAIHPLRYLIRSLKRQQKG